MVNKGNTKNTKKKNDTRMYIYIFSIFRKPLQEELVELRKELSLVAQRPSGFKASDIYPFQEKVIYFI